MTPGRIIHDRRVARGLTQSQLAIRAGSTQAAISRIENGEVSPTFATFERLLSVMGDDAEIEVRGSSGYHDRARLASLRALTPEQRLTLAIGWNRMAGEFGRAGASARGRPR